MYYGLDISKWQDTYNADTAKAKGINDVILRAAYGANKDVKFDTFYTAAKVAGQTVGAYGFATWHYRSINNGNIAAARAVMLAQTNAWIAICKDKLDGYFAIDQELESGYAMGLNASDNETLLNECIALLTDAGFTVCVYCSASWAMEHFNKDNINADLWLAYYYADPADPNFGEQANYQLAAGRYFAYMRSCGSQLMGWQFGRIGFGEEYGVGSPNVDRNVFYKYAMPATISPPLSELPVRIVCGYASSGDMLALMELFNQLRIPFTVTAGYITSVDVVLSGDQSVIATLSARLGVPCEIAKETGEGLGPDILPPPEPDADVVAKLQQIIVLIKEVLAELQGA